MSQLIQHVTAVWPIILLLGFFVALVIAWFATRGIRKRMQAAQAQMIDVYERTIKAQERLTTELTREKSDCEKKHDSSITEYRTIVHELRNQLQVKSDACAQHMVDLADLRARTDFKPVMDFQLTWYQESQILHQKMLETMTVVAPLLQEVASYLKKNGNA